MGFRRQAWRFSLDNPTFTAYKDPENGRLFQTRDDQYVKHRLHTLSCMSLCVHEQPLLIHVGCFSACLHGASSTPGRLALHVCCLIVCVVWLFGCATLSTESLLLCSLADFLYSVTVVPCWWRSLRSNCPRWCFLINLGNPWYNKLIWTHLWRGTHGWLGGLGTENKEFFCGAASCSVLDFVLCFLRFLCGFVQNSNTMPPVNNSRQLDLVFG